MASKKTYIYRIMIGHVKNEKTDIYIDTFMYARNSKVALEYCKGKYKDKKYDYYYSIKVGVSHVLRDTQIVSDEEAEMLRNSIASKGDKYREIETEVKFITKEEAGGLL